MRLAVIMRVTFYLIGAAAAALAVLAVRTFPAERTWVDRYENWHDEHLRKPHIARRDCGWRVLLCREIPPLPAAIAPSWDSASAGVAIFRCEGMFGLYACLAEKGDTAISLLAWPDSERASFSRSWAPVERDAAYDGLVRAGTLLYGPAHLCPPNDDRMFTEDRQWQLEGRFVSVVKVGDSRLEMSTESGRAYCHIGP